MLAGHGLCLTDLPWHLLIVTQYPLPSSKLLQVLVVGPIGRAASVLANSTRLVDRTPTICQSTIDAVFAQIQFGYLICRLSLTATTPSTCRLQLQGKHSIRGRLINTFSSLGQLHSQANACNLLPASPGRRLLALIKRYETS